MKIFNKNTTEYDLISISHFFYPRVGGLENMAYNLVSGLQKKGLKCMAVFGSEKKYRTTIDGFEINSFKVKNIFDGTYPIFGLDFVFYIFKLIKDNPNSKVVIHSRHMISSIISAFICIILGHNYTLIEHNAGKAFFNSPFITKLASWVDRNIFKFVPKFAENVVAVSKTGKKWVSRTFDISKENIDIIYNGYDSKEIKNSFSKKENIVVWAAKWIEVKDPSTTLRAYKKIASLYPNWKFILIGQGKALKAYRFLPSNIEIIPKLLKQEDLFRLLRKSKIYINSSLSEGLALGILEASAFGNIPVISNAPSNKELAKEIDTSEYVFNRGNAMDMTKALKIAIENSEDIILNKRIAHITKAKFANSTMVSKYFDYLYTDYNYQTNIEKLSIVIPVYNEQATITKLLKKVSSIQLPLNIQKEIIIVDDASTDRSVELIEKYITENNSLADFKLLFNTSNLGKSQTVKHGVLHTTGDLVVVQDADLEYNPQDLAEFVKIFIDNPRTDLIYGNRFNLRNPFINRTHYLGNKFVTLASNILTTSKGFAVKDMETCYKMGRGYVMRDVFSTLVSTTNFGLEPEATAKFAHYRKLNNRKLNLRQLDIYYRPRTVEQGKKMKWFKHGFEAIQEIVRFNVLYKEKPVYSNFEAITK